jgi:hypothetical protein
MFLAHPKSLITGQRDHVAAVFGFRKPGQPPGTADGVQPLFAPRHVSRGCRSCRSAALGFQAILDHRQIARFKDMQRQPRRAAAAAPRAKGNTAMVSGRSMSLFMDPVI